MSLLDKLPKLPFVSGGNSSSEYFFALNILPHVLEAALWGIEGRKLVILNTFSTKYPTNEKLTQAANYVLDEALADFPFEPTKILFGVPETWIQDDNLKPEHLKLLRSLSKDLDLAPMAFVSSSHAISHLLQKQQGVPLTAVLVEVGDPMTVSVVKAGKVITTKMHKRTDDLPKDIEKVLLGFSEVEVLPSKIVLYGEEDLTKFKEELQTYSWMKDLPFLHLPKIENLPLGTTLKAICLAGGSELEENIIYSEKNIAKDANVVPVVAMEEVPVRRRSMEDDYSEDEIVEPDMPTHQKVGPVSTMLAPLAKVKQAITSPFSPKEPHPNAPAPKGIKGLLLNKLFIVPAILLVLLIVGVVVLPKAKVDVFIDMQNLENSATITADPNVTAVSESNNIIPGKLVDDTVDGSAKGTASGQKKIGDPAKGKVLVYNATTNGITLNKGTILTSDSGAKFTLDSEVKVASKSASAADPPTSSSPTDATASEIGPDGNIAAGSNLKVGDFSKSDVVAKVDTAFAGGVSKNVSVVTADDQKKLLATLTSELRQKAQQEIQGKLSGDMKILPEALTENIISQSFSKKVGDQATDFTLNVTAKYTGTAYSDNDLKQLVSKLVSTNVPDGFELDVSKTETQAEVSKVEKDGKLIFSAKFVAKLNPKLDQNQIKRDIAGKTIEQAAERLKQVNNVIGSQVMFTPPLPAGPWQRLPILPQNITLEITAK
jgi:hypothetical protein